MGIFIGILEEGLIYSILALGVLITYRVLDFPDLTVDSSFPLGAAVTAILTVNGVNPVLSLLVAMLAGAAAGLVTGLIHVKCRVRDLLSGIITMTGLYSINLRIAGRANLPFFNMSTIFDNAFVRSFPAFLQPYSKVIVVLVIVLIVKILLDLFMNTKAGFLLRHRQRARRARRRGYGAEKPRVRNFDGHRRDGFRPRRRDHRHAHFYKPPEGEQLDRRNHRQHHL